MIPSRRWFPGGLQDRAAWYDNFNTQIQLIGLSLGLTQAELDQISDDNAVMQFLANVVVQFEAYADAVRQYRIIITEGVIGAVTPQFPVSPIFTLPAVIPTGMFERLVDVYRERIMASAPYTDEQGALLGIIAKSEGPNVPLPELQPAIKASESTGDYAFTVDVTRLGMPAYKVQIQRQGASTWNDAAFSTGNPCVVTVTPTTPGQPERILVRAQLVKGSDPVGIPSDPTYVTINP